MSKFTFYDLNGTLGQYIYKIRKLPSNMAVTEDIEQLRRSINKIVNMFKLDPATKDNCGKFWYAVTTMGIKGAVSDENKRLPSYIKLMSDIDGMKRILIGCRTNQ